jgi:SAM-dependent methyltransferase
LKIAGVRGHIATGVEPNPIMAKIASDKGYNVVNGYFPAAIQPTSKFDVIIFNDVFEHIPDLNEILNNCKIFLNDDGVLIISLPNSGGVFFRLAKMLATVGITGPWNRLWQVMFYTPHLHYFGSGSLDGLLMKHDFMNQSKTIEIEAVSLSGLWDRLAIDNSRRLLTRVFLYIGIVVFYPITKLFEQDAFFSIYKRKSHTTNQGDGQ